MLKLDNGVEIPVRTAYMKDNTKCFKINNIDVNKIKVSEKKLCSKTYNSYKYYVFYEDDNEYVPLRIILKDVLGKYSIYRDREINEDVKSMSFKFDDEVYYKISAIFERIGKIKDIDFNDYTYESKDEEYFKTKVNDETCFKEGKDIITLTENIKYTCRALLHLQSVFFNMKDNEDDIRYSLQTLLEQCVYKPFINNTIFHRDLEVTDTEPDSESESEKELNENTVFDE